MTASRAIALGLLTAGLVFAGGSVAGLSTSAASVAALTALCALWWTLEPIPIPVTSLLPFVVLPVLGLLDKAAAAAAFGHPLILLLLGGFLLSAVMERNGAHERLALSLVNLLGSASGARTLFAVMVACAFLSMWISNTATTLMLLPVVGAIVSRSSHPERLAAPMAMGLAWSASIGGLGTPVGSPPNLLVLAELEKHGPAWSFTDWMSIGLPVVIAMVPLAAGWVCRGGRLSGVTVEPVAVPPWTLREGLALGLFASTAALWVTRSGPWGGWSRLLETVQVGDHTVALGAVVVACLLPDGRGERLLDWPTAARVPWGLLLLFSGGIALGGAFKTSGLDVTVASGLATLGTLPVPVTVLSLALGVTFFTEVTSNTATAALLMPILGIAAVAAGQSPTSWLVAAGLSASCAFMLPVATAPNAIVVGSGQVSTRQLALNGLAMNLLGALVITAVVLLLS